MRCQWASDDSAWCLQRSKTGDFRANWDPHWFTFGWYAVLRKAFYVDNILIQYLYLQLYVQLYDKNSYIAYNVQNISISGGIPLCFGKLHYWFSISISSLILTGSALVKLDVMGLGDPEV